MQAAGLKAELWGFSRAVKADVRAGALSLIPLRPALHRRIGIVRSRERAPRPALLALTTALYLRQHYLTPLLTSNLNLPSSAWIVNQWYTKAGKFAFPARGSQLVGVVSRLCPAASRGTSNDFSPAQCLSQHGYRWWASYQPGSRFWPFQWIEAGWLLALSVLLIAVTVWLVRRKAA